MPSDIVDEIRAFHRQRCYMMACRQRADHALGAFIRTQLGWSLRLSKAEREQIERRARLLIADPASSPFEAVITASQAAAEPFAKVERQCLRKMTRRAEILPVWEAFGRDIRGFGAGSLAVIVGEAGDLDSYATHSRLWKRMGLAVIDGVRQGGLRSSAGREQWITHGYSPIRRSRMWNIGDSLIKGNREGRYRGVYLARKDYERARATMAGLTVAPAAKIPAKRRDEFMSEIHVHLRAQRYMEKRLLRDLWRAWRRASCRVPEKAKIPMPDADISDCMEAAR
jgi:hypothetical protein